MVLHFQKTLSEALKNIAFQGEYNEFLVYNAGERCGHKTIKNYGKAKWEVVDLLNRRYSTVLKNKFDLFHWLHYNEKDELAYFLNEAGSNCLNYSEFKAPYKFHLWLGQKGFIVAIEQKGKGFPAERVHPKNIKENEGAAFEFFKKAKNSIFFNDPKNAAIIYMEHLF